MRATAVVACVALAVLAVLCLVDAADYKNPVLVQNNPDPGVLLYKGVYYAATTSGDAPNHFPIHSSTDLVNWRPRGHVFPQNGKNNPTWAKQDYWAPEIHLVNGKFNVYFVARDHTGMLCVGVAVAESPLGPYRDIGHPLARNASMGYIDPTFHQFVNKTDGNRTTNYLYWKTDGNAINKPCDILVQPLTPDGLAFMPNTQKKTLITNDLAWEGPVVEAPWVVKHREEYFLFYSGNGCCDVNGPDGTNLYAVGVAVAPTPVGPFVKKGQPILQTYFADKNSVFTGPGHCSVVPFKDDWYMVYHAWTRTQVAGAYPRHMLTDKVTWEGRWPEVNKGYPSFTSQPVP